MNWDQQTTVTLTEAEWSEIKCALWDSYGMWVQRENDTKAKHVAELRNLINDQLARPVE